MSHIAQGYCTSKTIAQHLFYDKVGFGLPVGLFFFYCLAFVCLFCSLGFLRGDALGFFGGWIFFFLLGLTLRFKHLLPPKKPHRAHPQKLSNEKIFSLYFDYKIPSFCVC